MHTCGTDGHQQGKYLDFNLRFVHFIPGEKAQDYEGWWVQGRISAYRNIFHVREGSRLITTSWRPTWGRLIYTRRWQLRRKTGLCEVFGHYTVSEWYRTAEVSEIINAFLIRGRSDRKVTWGGGSNFLQNVGACYNFYKVPHRENYSGNPKWVSNKTYISFVGGKESRRM